MKAIVVMFDSLRKCDLPCYGNKWVKAPNFERLAEKTVTFTNAWVGSMPCMPTRRELHTGRYNFLHRSWGPLEPFDDSMPEILKENDIYTHLVSDHYHYWEDGGCTYHNRYSSWQASRGQEGDPWRADLTDNVAMPETLNVRPAKRLRHDWVNRHYMPELEHYPQAKTFKMGCEFIKTNHAKDNWMLHIETFDPHEPFFSDPKFKALYKDDYRGKLFDWPCGGKKDQGQEITDHLRKEYAALVSMCDEHLGKVLDLMDEYSMWDDTMLIVNTDHGLMLGEKDCWLKCSVPWYNEVANIPLFLWDPRTKIAGEKNDCLVQNIDVPPTLLNFFGLEATKDMQGIPLDKTVGSLEPLREAVLFGNSVGHVNCTDGRYVYMRAPKSKDNAPLNNYTLMPTHMNCRFRINELEKVELAEPFSFSKGVKTMKIPFEGLGNAYDMGTMLFDLQSDPNQLTPVKDVEIEKRMIAMMVDLMEKNDSPEEQWQRLGLPQPMFG
ncbi:MAG: sulfatase [Sedimentisphaeraceae bacterium JB056]